MKPLVAIPVFNEVDNVAAVIGRARRYVQDILVVNDGSTDGTAGLLDGMKMPGLSVLSHKTNCGYGRSLRDAFAWCLREKFDCLITLDADGQHEPDFIPVFLSDMRTADIVSGSRYLAELTGASAPPGDRRCINENITGLLRWRLGLEITDAFRGYKAYRAGALARLDITEDGYGMPLQLWVQAAALGMSVYEVPVRLIYKDANRSFGGNLDRSEVRIRYYLNIIQRECQRWNLDARCAAS